MISGPLSVPSGIAILCVFGILPVELSRLTQTAMTRYEPEPHLVDTQEDDEEFGFLRDNVPLATQASQVLTEV